MATPKHLILSIENMSCASCTGRVERALTALSGVTDVSVNLANENADLMVDSPDKTEKVVRELGQLGYPARTASVDLRIENMSCASCVGRVDKAIAALPGVQSVAVNLAQEQAHVVYVRGAVTPTELAAAAGAAGYPATVADADAPDDLESRKSAEADALWRRTLIAAALALPVFVMEMGGHMIPAFHHLIAQTIGTQASWIIQAILTTLVLAGPGRGFYRVGLPALFKGTPDMNSLVAVGTLAAYLYSMTSLFAPGLLPAGSRVVYFEAAAVIVVLILLGRTLEARAKGRTGAAIKQLVGLQPKMARVQRDGTWTMVKLSDIHVGDLIQVRPGERIPADGVIQDGAGHVDQSMITGEPVPVQKSPGDQVTGGTVNGAASLTIRAEQVGADTILAGIVRMVQDAQGAKLPIQGLVDRITMWFVPAVLITALVTVIVWLVSGAEPSFAMVAGVSVLIIACPCAMGLATPTSIVVGTGRAAELGVLFRKGDALQRMAEVEIIAFDKTGTLTIGQPKLTGFETSKSSEPADVLRTIAAIEAQSEHPIARAIAAAAEGSLPHATDVRALDGLGITGRVDGDTWLIGSQRLMAEHGIETATLSHSSKTWMAQGHSVFYAAKNEMVAACLGVSDPIKPTAPDTVAALKSQGHRVVMITGDNAQTAEAIAEEIGITEVIADVLPAGKVDALKSFAPAPIAFIGDGINDAPALAYADVGVAIGTGTDIAIEAADVVLMSGDVQGVGTAFAASHQVMRNIRQNLFWAFGYNVALIPVAAGVFYPLFGVLLSPVFAAAAMALSSVFVLSNALRLRRMKGPVT